MLLVDEIHLFARDFIDFKSFRTTTRKKKIREVYKSLFGESIKISCSTCYIEALLKIINNTKMATNKYELRKGVLLEAFGDASKTCTNDTITDEIGDWYMKNQPEKLIYFSRYSQGSNLVQTTIPGGIRVVPPTLPPNVTIIPPKIIRNEDPEKRKLLVDRAIDLGFKSSSENPIEMISSEELNVIIMNLEKVKIQEIKEEPAEKEPKKPRKTKK